MEERSTWGFGIEKDRSVPQEPANMRQNDIAILGLDHFASSDTIITVLDSCWQFLDIPKEENANALGNTPETGVSAKAVTKGDNIF